MDVNDRGTIKWTSLMLPEHVQMLGDMYKSMDKKAKPILDEQQIAENGLKLQEALEYDLLVRIKYFTAGAHEITEGYLLSIDVRNKTIYMEETRLMFEDIIDVNIL